jgi:DNA-binding LacI/PurR family transcriptional regulator/serine phosphatase RsbU (regulator of sigma subunit)
VLTAEVSNGYAEPILCELAEAAHEMGARLINFLERLGTEDIDDSRPLIADLVGAPRVDAVLVLPVGWQLGPQDIAEYCERFRALPVCCVPDVAADWCSRVSVDNEPGMRAVLTHLVEVHGYRRIAFVRGPAESDEAELRYRVYREVLAEHGLAFDPDLVAPGWYVLQSGVDAVRLLLDERKLVLDAIACANDGMAFGVMEALAARNIEVPRQVAVVGFDDVDLARYYDPPLTTARQPLRELGRTALDVLMAQLAPGARPQREVLSSRLVVRESCGCLGANETRHQAARAPIARQSLGAPERVERVAGALRALGIPGAPGGAWERHLFQSFLGDLSRNTGEFLGELRALLHTIARVRGDVGGFHKVLTIIRQHVQESYAPSALEQQDAESLLHAARIVVSGIAERTQSLRQVRFEEFTFKLARTAGALSRTLDLAGISRVLRDHLPQYGIAACYVCLYDEGTLARPTHSRLIAGFGEALTNLEGLPADAPRFPASMLLPEPAFSAQAPTQYLIGPLTRLGHMPGYAVFARGPMEGFVYETLLDQLGSAVGRLDLMQRLLSEAALREAAERERMGKELMIAQRIQSGILPGAFAVKGLDIAAVMRPATEVGGDYYDILPGADGCWLGIGDVAGHGLPAGLVMLMLQSVVSGLVRSAVRAAPRDIVLAVNAVLYDNIRERMAQDEHVTLTLLHCDDEGRVTFAGAHEDILVYRARERQVEWIQTPGTWVGAVREISQVTVDSCFQLEPSDVLFLYTDGVTESRNAQGEAFGPERLAHALESTWDRPAAEIRDAVLNQLKAWIFRQDDDFSLLIVKRHAG